MDAWISNWRKRLVQAQRKRHIIILSLITTIAILSLGLTTYAWARKDLTIIDNGNVLEVKTFAKNVELLLAEQGITLGAEDEISYSLAAPLEDNMTITITRAFPVTIKVDGRELVVNTTPTVVEEILKKARVYLGSEDIVTPALKQQVVASQEIVISRITTKEVALENEIPFKTERRSDDSLDKGVTKVLNKGEAGLERKIIKVTYKDGEEIKREEVKREIVKEPVPQVIAYGTHSTISRGGQNLRFSRSLTVTATAYTHTGNRTKSGTVPKVGTVAVDPNVIPLGSKLYVDGYGFGRALDVGSAIKGNRIDVFVESEQQAQKWGRKKVKVYILE